MDTTVLPTRPGSRSVFDESLLHWSVRAHLLLATISLLMAVALLLRLPAMGETLIALESTLIACLLWAVVCVGIWRGLDHHPHDLFGPANVVTLYRAAGAVLLASWIPGVQQSSVTEGWILALSAVLLLILDGVDGYLARRSGLGSAFGARFDMEVDALLTLIICVLLWRSGETGAWILVLGLTRYVFLLAGRFLTALERDLFPSFRRKLICVLQLATLCALLSPLIEPPWSGYLGVFACGLLLASFARDSHWLLTKSA